MVPWCHDDLYDIVNVNVRYWTHAVICTNILQLAMHGVWDTRIPSYCIFHLGMLASYICSLLIKKITSHRLGAKPLPEQLLTYCLFLALAGFPQPTLSVKICILAAKTCLFYAFVMQQPFGIPSRNLSICIFVASTVSVFNHIVVSASVLVVLSQ